MKGFSFKKKSKQAKKLSYLVTVPERTLRAILSYSVGIVDLGVNTMLPKALKRTSFYKVSYGMMRQFIVEKVLEIEQGADEAEHDLSEDYMIRKLAGNSLDALGLFTIRFSPLWVFSVVSDVTRGSDVYFETLKKHLVDNGVIETGEGIESIQALLAQLHKASDLTASTIDLPPLALREFKQTMKELSGAYSELGAESKKINALMDNVWREMRRISTEEGLAMETLCGVMSAEALKLYGSKTAQSTRSFVMANYELLDAYVFRSYAETLCSMRHVGVKAYVQDHMAPFAALAQSVYDETYTTWTGKAIKKIEVFRNKK
ncbi:MAG: hypothetical protein JXO44_08530 [Clostridia bacterium]|nr:hypothetical protein [Clostridia bacterium]